MASSLLGRTRSSNLRRSENPNQEALPPLELHHLQGLDAANAAEMELESVGLSAGAVWVRGGVN